MKKKDLLLFLNIICRPFTNNILTIDDQERIALYEPHLQTPDSLPTPTRNDKHKGMILYGISSMLRICDYIFR